MKKPVCKLIGENGNVFNLLGKSQRCLKENGYFKEVEEMSKRVFEASSYEEALRIMIEYVEVE